MTQWPTTLPLPKVEASGNPNHVTIASPLTSGRLQRRNRFYAACPVLNIEWLFSLSQMPLFEVFHDTDLDNGAAQFEIELRYPNPMELSVWSVRFLEGYSTVYDDGHWQVTATIQLLQTTLPPVAPIVGYTLFYVMSSESDGGHIPFVVLGDYSYSTKT